MDTLWIGVLLAQQALMGLDEFYIHSKRYKRHFPVWERWGHPMDLVVVAAATGVLVFFDRAAPELYVALAVISCLLVTKDEWVHARECDGFEQWVHAMCYQLHPLSFVALWSLGRPIVLWCFCLQLIFLGVLGYRGFRASRV